MGRLGCGYPRCKYLLMVDLRESLTVAAPADLVYGLVADLPRMGEWSPECERVTW
ncbi:MAG: SRPBCC family protein, partial [Actinomycetota bacterium]